MNDIIIDEWKRNKEQTQKDLTDLIKSGTDTANMIREYITDQHAQVLFDKYRVEENLRSDIALAHIEEVEKLIMSSHKVPIKDELKLKVVELALQKKAPFHNSKNNIADALILFSISDYIGVSHYVLHDTIFVSDNYKDFCVDAKANDIHPEIREQIHPSCKLTFTRNIAEALHLAPTFVDEIDDWLESELENQALWEWEMMRGR